MAEFCLKLSLLLNSKIKNQKFYYYDNYKVWCVDDIKNNLVTTNIYTTKKLIQDYYDEIIKEISKEELLYYIIAGDKKNHEV